MMFVALIFIPNSWCCMWVAFSIISIEVGVIGYMALWSVNLDSVSMINLIMCIGFSVDFSAHISYAFLAAKVNTSNERVRECLYNLGLPVLQGGCSTTIGVLILVFAPSYIFLAFFKIVFLVIFFGVLHGLLLLPVLLSILGPRSTAKPEPGMHKESYQPHSIEYQDPKLTSTEPPKPTLSLVKLTKEDNDSLDRDLGLGSSGSSSHSSLHDIEGNSLAVSDSESTPRFSSRAKSSSPRCLSRTEVKGNENDAFVHEDETSETEKL